MTTPRQRELAQLGTAMQRGDRSYYTTQRFQQLLQDEVTERLRAQMPAIEAEARRRVAVRNEAREAARRAGMAAGIAAGRAELARQQARRKR